MNGSQAESMKRLIKDGKIVGHMKIEPYSDTLGFSFSWSYSSEPDRFLSVLSHGFPHFDSFDLGIKVGDEWFFENDIFTRQGGREFVLKYYDHDEYENKYWNIVPRNRTKDSILYDGIRLKLAVAVGFKHIGNVYESEGE